MMKFSREQLEAYNNGSLYGCFGELCNYTRTFVECGYLKFKNLPSSCSIQEKVISAKFETVSNVLPLLAIYFSAHALLKDGYVFEGNEVEVCGLIEIKNIEIIDDKISGSLFVDEKFHSELELRYCFGWPQKEIHMPNFTEDAEFPPEKLKYACYNKPSVGFGDVLSAFDDGSQMPRLPSPPLLAVTAVVSHDENHCRTAFVVEKGTYPKYIPYVIYLESALQPCGWLSCVSILPEFKQPMFFRNLEGKVDYMHPVYCDKDVEITYDVALTQKIRFGNTMVMAFNVEGFVDGQSVLKLETKFGFHTEQALQKQIGLKNIEVPCEKAYEPIVKTTDDHPFSMVDDILYYSDQAIIGRRMVSPDDWYFKSHFFKDPVQPGSLGLEGLIECAINFARKKFGTHDWIFSAPMSWKYRGQVLPKNTEVKYQVNLKENNDQVLKFEGFLFVDNICIYHLEEFYLKNSF